MKIFHHSTHKRFWNYIAENPGTEKYYALTKMTNEEKYQLGFYYCTACKYAKECSDCPFNLEHDSSWMRTNCLGGLYKKWVDETDLDLQSEYARQIRDLPVRDDVETD